MGPTAWVLGAELRSSEKQQTLLTASPLSTLHLSDPASLPKLPLATWTHSAAPCRPLPLLPLSSSLPFPPRLRGYIGRCHLQPPPPHSPATAPSPWPFGKTPAYPGASRNPVPLPHPSSCPSPRTPGLPAPCAPTPPENRGVLLKPPPLHWGAPFRVPPPFHAPLPFSSPTFSFPSHPSPHPGPPCKSGVRRGEG